MKYRIVKEPKISRYGEYTETFYIQTATLDKWMGQSEWEWLCYKDDEGEKSRFRFSNFDDALAEVKMRLDPVPAYEVVWEQP